MVREKLALKRKGIRNRRRKKLFLSLAACFLIAAVSLGLYTGFNFSFADKNSSAEKNSESETILPTLQKNMTIMILGVDEREKDVGRSDTLMLLNLSGEKASLLSIPRDTRVYIEKRGGWQKINAAYAHGGEELTRKTLEKFLGLEVDRFVKVNVDEFIKLIDVVGGIDIFVEKSMHYEDPWDDNGGLFIHIDKGLHHLDGQTAMEFVRFRDSEGDAGRVRRQQAFMQACAEKISDPALILKLPKILSVAKDAVETDLTSAEMLAVAGTLKSAENSRQIKTGTVPGSWQYIGGVSYLVPNVLRLGEVMKQNLGIDADEKHFEKLAKTYPPISAYNMYDVNPDIEKDLKILDRVERENFDLSDNEM